MAKLTKNEIREAALERVQYFNAVLAMKDDAAVRRGKRKTLDPNVPDEVGWWVDCQVWVQEPTN